MEADFEGWATKYNLKCSDGRVILDKAFQHQSGHRVPLVWAHGRNSPTNVLGYVELEHREGGMWSKAFFNNTEHAAHAREMVRHGDVRNLSIWANKAQETAGRVRDGFIREVSLVLAGANPGALIENVTIAHSDGYEDEREDEFIIQTGIDIEIEHSATTTGHEIEETELEHEGAPMDKTVGEVYEAMTEEQKTVLHYMVGAALEGDDDIEQGEFDDVKTKNLFENDNGDAGNVGVISHEDAGMIFADAARTGSLKTSVEAYAFDHGIENLGVLFPEAMLVGDNPQLDTRKVEWVDSVIGGAHKSPFARIKTIVADLTFEQARAKGYVTGNMKKEEFFALSRRVTSPTTVYKKQKMDRDDIIDIRDFDTVGFLRREMRFMLDEEIAGAILVGDGRAVDDEDRVNPEHIRPIADENDFFARKVHVPTPSVDVKETIDALIKARKFYKGSGNPTFFTTEDFLAEALTVRDNLGHRLYRTPSEIAAEIRCSSIVTVDIFDRRPGLVGILVNMADYNVGTDRGGEVTMFDDFDIDYNKYKYLIETRFSGALVRPHSALVVMEASGSMITPTAPTYDTETFTLTIPTQANIQYVNREGAIYPAGDMVLVAGSTAYVIAEPISPNGITSNAQTQWSFLRPSE